MASQSTKHFQEYVLCIIFQLVLPLLPIALEAWFTGTLSEKSLMISVSIYAISIGNTSRNKLLFGCTVLVSIIFSVCFGLVIGGGEGHLPPYSMQLAGGSLIAVFLTSAIERYAIHVTEKTECWAFK